VGVVALLASVAVGAVLLVLAAVAVSFAVLVCACFAVFAWLTLLATLAAPPEPHPAEPSNASTSAPVRKALRVMPGNVASRVGSGIIRIG
jgi:threonine/homoserine/homoserine lactone efflux protein